MNSNVDGKAVTMQMQDVSEAVAKLVVEQGQPVKSEQPKPDGESKQKGRRERRGGGRVQGSGAMARMNRK